MPENSRRRAPEARRPAQQPHQVALIALTVVGWPMIAGVHSTVWILAISAELISRAFA